MQTTDPQDELFYHVDKNDKVIGPVKRGDAHRNPHIIHRVSHILLFNSKGELLMQLRSLTKDKYPGFWVNAASGHVDYGSDYLATAVKEINEELGISIQSEELTELGKILVANKNESEYVTFYKLQITQEIFDFKLKGDEVSSVEFFSIDHVKKMLKNPHEKFTPVTRVILEKIL
jgi:isopentenyl-diphosphate delta-isomerase type 1